MNHVRPNRWPAALVLAGFVVTAIGFAAHAMWRVLPWERFALSLLLAGASLLVAWPLRRWRRWSWASAIASSWIAALIWFVGPGDVLAVSMLIAAALAIGLRLGCTQSAVALAAGLMLIAGIAGWTLTWPVHTMLTWYALLAAVLLWRRQALRKSITDLQRQWRAAVATAPRWAGCAVLLIGLASTACWLPTMQSDDLAYHLGLPYQLLLHGRFDADPTHQVWANAPWAGDVLHGVAMLLARGEARGALNAAWLVLAASLSWTIARCLGATPVERWAAVALFASFPALVWMAAGMQTELAATAVLLALAAVVMSNQPPRLLAGAVLLAGLAALKGFHFASALPLLAYAAWRHRATWSWRPLLGATALALVVCGSSYRMSWQRSGNPVLPLLNGYFRSPLMAPHSFSDVRWLSGFTPSLPWRMVFDTDHFVEAWDGGIGFTLIAPSGLWVVALLRQTTRGFAAVATLVLLIPLVPLQYARYAYPGIALFGSVLLPGARLALGRKGFAWGIATVCVVNLAFQANASWLHHSAALKRVIRSGGDVERIYPYYVPERTLLFQLPAGDQGLVLSTDPQRSDVAELAGRGRTVSYHDPALARAWQLAIADTSASGWAHVLSLSGARWVLMTPASKSDTLQAALDQRHARLFAERGDAQLWRLPDDVMHAP